MCQSIGVAVARIVKSVSELRHISVNTPRGPGGEKESTAARNGRYRMPAGLGLVELGQREIPLTEDVMKKSARRTLWITAAAALASRIALVGSSLAQSAPSLPVPGYEAAKDIAGAGEMPDPSLTYKVVFDISKAAAKIDEVNPGLAGVARYVNTLARCGVSADHRKIAVVLHQGATEVILNNAAFKARNDGHDNPNIALIQDLKKAGVDLRVCGQAVLGRKIDPATIQPEIELDLWALTTLTNLELRGYVHVGGN